MFLCHVVLQEVLYILRPGEEDAVYACDLPAEDAADAGRYILDQKTTIIIVNFEQI